jgi:hypothetical protein
MVLLASAAALAEAPQVITEKGKDHFETVFSPGGRLQLEVRSGDVRISGTDRDRLSVRYEGPKGGETDEVEVRFQRTGAGGSVKISGGPRNNFHILIEVPRETELHVRMPFGALEIERVLGSKDVEVHAGQLTIDVGDPKDYALIDSSVTTGALNSGPLGISKGGLFRSFKKEGPGKYRLYAHVGSGEIDLR